MTDMFPILFTFVESLYLLYMFFLYKTKYSFQNAIWEEHIQSLGYFFVHNTHQYENKVCAFGKFMAVFAVLLAILRLYWIYTCPSCIGSVVLYSILFDTVCLILAFSMNMNALVYILPLFLSESALLYLAYRNIKKMK